MTKLGRRLGGARFEADEHYRLALLAFQRNGLESALGEIAFAISLHPTLAEYHAAQGWFFRENGEKGQARESFDTALELNPYDMLANYAHGMSAYLRKDWQTASSFFMNALAAIPSRPETRYYLALVNHRLGDNDAALRWMRAARDGFVKAADKRDRQSHAWIQEFEKLLAEP